MIGPMSNLPASVLIIDGYPLMRVALCNAVAAEPDLQVAKVDLNDSLTLEIPGVEDAVLIPNRLDLILLSMGNPGLKDLQALRTLHQSRPEIPILALTTNEVPGQEQAALDAGAEAVITKTASRREIIQALREMWRKHSIHYHSKALSQEVNENTVQ
jgi:two-component system, NarL family, response regulator